MPASFECVTRTTMSRAELFHLSLSIDAHTESMGHSKETAVAGVTSGSIGLGEEVTWRAWHFGVPLRMTSRITYLEAPSCFVDEQVNGPFRYFRHVHDFREDAAGTTMTERIEFAAPFGPLGRLVEKMVLTRYLKKLIETRNEFLVSGA
ncbi:SRPBCC family protein [Arthrobacter glacialis]|uniref:Cyclase n=1 Tax=Arthrobacter glacialis TaxID=1664 RepID=A0A2S3ZWF4_ARTGL|nr:SRPBCC family protein [Arthrobacter glacialis]POH73404.1 cyclase [Arthrobacter glacialis]